MSALDFLDTNILVCAYDGSSPRKQRIAQELLRTAVSGRALISTQVLSELSTVLLHKVNPPSRPQQVIAILDAIGPIRTISPVSDTVRRAVLAHAQYGIHFYDGLIVATAEQAGCTRIWSEDLNPGQQYFNLKVENPFA